MSAVELQRNGAAYLDAIIADALSEIRLSSQQLSEACAVTPKQFWTVADLYCAVLIAASHQSETFAAAAEGFESIGKWSTIKDPRSSLLLFCDFALFKLAGTLISNPHKRLSILRVLLAFSTDDPSSRIQCIKRLQSIIPDLPVFITCLTILAAHETQMDDSLLDLYLYYGTIGLGLQSPRLRAGAMAVFSALLPRAYEIVAAMLPQFLTMAKQESWWEIHAHLLSLSGSLLEIDHMQRDPASASSLTSQAVTPDLCLEIIHSVFHPNVSRNVKLWGIHTLSSALVVGEPLAGVYLEVLLTMSPEDRQLLLRLDKEKGHMDVFRIPLPASNGIPFVVEPVTLRWHPMAIASALISSVRKNNLDRLEAEQLEVLYGCVVSIIETAADNTAGLDDSWVTVYTSLKDYIIVGLCDQNSCRSSSGILRCFLKNSKLKTFILKEPRFIGILRLLYPEDGSGSSLCQQNMEDFFRDVYTLGDPYSSTVVTVLENFAKAFTTNFDNSNLHEVLHGFSG